MFQSKMIPLLKSLAFLCSSVAANLLVGCGGVLPLKSDEAQAPSEDSETAEYEILPAMPVPENYRKALDQPCEFPANYPVQVVRCGVHPLYRDLLRPRETGWLGSDGAHSIPLADDRILWLFGDTPIGTLTDGKRDRDFAFLNNTIGIQTGSPGEAGTVEFYWGTHSGKPESFFVERAGTAGSVLWPVSGALMGGELFVGCYSVNAASGTIELSGTVLIRIPNPGDPPSRWKKTLVDIDFDSGRRAFVSTIFVTEPWAYFLGYDDPEGAGMRRRAVLARAKTTDLLAAEDGSVLEFWVQGADGPQWGKDPDGLVTLFSPGVTETAIHYEPDWGLYICPVYNAFSPNIYSQPHLNSLGLGVRSLVSIRCPNIRCLSPSFLMP